MTNSLFGNSPMILGPANMYVKPIASGSWDTLTGWTGLGLTESCIFRNMTGKSDLMASQKGDRPWNRVITSQRCQMEANLAEPTLEILEDAAPGMYLHRVATVIKQAMIVNKIGQTDRDNLMWVKLVELNGNVESADEFDTVYMLGSPSSESVEQLFNATDQRFWPVLFEAYENTDTLTQVKDNLGNIAYAWTGLKV